MRLRSVLSATSILLIAGFAQTAHAALVDESAQASAGVFGSTIYASDSSIPTALASIDTNNFASASVKSGGVGVGISTDNPSSSNYARASWTDSWTASSGSEASGLYIAGFHAEGSFSPALSDAILNQNSGTNFGGWFELKFQYQLGEINGNPAGVLIDLWTDGGGINVNNVQATWMQSVGGSDQSLLSNIVWGTNGSGNTTFLIDVHPAAGPFIGLGAPCPSFPCTIGESMDVSMALDGAMGFTAGTVVMADFLNTFTVDVQSTDPNALWTSEGGRTIGNAGPSGNQVPEPQTLLLMAMGMGLIRWTSRYSRR